MVKIDRTSDIENYQKAYMNANGDFPYKMSYENGWYLLRHNGIIDFRTRRIKLLEMTERLESREKEK